jgi:glycopeptide antibiotics resistance protein
LNLYSKHQNLSGARRLALTVLGLWLAGLLLATLGGRPRDAGSGVYFNWQPFATQVVTSEILANFFLFAPLGLLVSWVFPRAFRQILVLSGIAALLISFTLEIIQAYTPLGTAGDITDVLLNVSGCCFAAVPGAIFYRWAQIDSADVTAVDALK